MVRNKIQEERMREYFINAATEILKGEGLVCISARNVAERAGYSYATLYNYFKDIKDLIFECVKGFCLECKEFVKNESVVGLSGVTKIKHTAKSYVRYFLQYPGIFELFFIEKTSEMRNQSRQISLINSLFTDLTKCDFEQLIADEQISREESELLMNQIRFGLTGMLLLFLNRQCPSSFSEFVSQLDKYLDDAFLRVE